MRIKLLRIGVIAIGLCGSTIQAAPNERVFTISDSRNLPTSSLARELLGERLGAQVIEVARHEYEGSNGSVPSYVELYTQPVLTDPRINGICRTDVVTIEYNWTEMDPTPANGDRSNLPLKIAHMQAIPRYKAFPEPPSEPGTPENDAAQAAACAGMTTATDAFRAPSAGDAQWLAAIERLYRNANERFRITCKDFADRTCAQARAALVSLPLREATEVQLRDCPEGRTGDQVNYCYRIIFPYKESALISVISPYADIVDAPKIYDQEWVITVWAGMRTGSTPVYIRSLNLEHIPKSMPIP